MSKHTRLGLIGFLVGAVALLAATTVFVFAQESEPMANPECTAENMADAPTQIDELYADAQEAFDNGDVRGWLDNLRAMSWLTSSYRAFCDGYLFEGDGDGSSSDVIGPIIITEGIYTVTVTTVGSLTVELEAISEECSYFGMVVFDGDATDGAQEVLRIEDEPCTALLEIGNQDEAWRVEFSLVSAGD